MAVAGLQHRAVGLVEIIPPGARGRFDGTYPDQDTARRHHASRLGTLSFQHVRDLMVAEARRVPLTARACCWLLTVSYSVAGGEASG